MDEDPHGPAGATVRGQLGALQRELGAGDRLARDALTAMMFGAPEPERIGRYRILGVLGEGGMGVVFRAHDDELARPVALKVLHERDDAGPAARGRLLREAQAMAQLSHPNVVQVYDVGEHDGRVFLAMELIPGQTLEAWIRGLGEPTARARRWRELVAMFVQVGRGLAAAHDAGLIHRDFKPANALVGEDGRPRVLDFGLARARHADVGSDDAGEGALAPSLFSSDVLAGPTASDGAAFGSAGATPQLVVTMTATGAILGTPAYISPEQLAGASAGPASDQFSFCVALHEALSGVRPFVGDSLPALARAMRDGARAPLPPGVEIPRWIGRALDRGLDRDPAARWPSMHALLEALLDDPAIRRRRRILVGGAALLAGAISLGAWVHEEREQARCEAAGAAVRDTWSADRGEALHAAFAATGLTYADDTATRAIARLDGWADTWADARAEACDAARSGDERARLRGACLDRQRWQLQSTVDLLSAADDALVARTVPMIAGLPRPTACDTPGGIAAAAAASRGEATRDELVRVRQELAQVAVDERAGRLKEAEARATEARADADAAGDDVLRAEALAALGSVQTELGDHKAAEASLRAAFFLASGIGYDPVVVRAGTSLMAAVGYHGARPTEGFDWAEHVRAASRRMDADLEPRFFELLGYVQTAAAEYTEAAASLERALELRVDRYGAEHPGLAEPLGDLGTIHRILGDLERAAASTAQALEIRERTLGPRHPSVASALRDLGQIAQLRKDFAGAVVRYRQALALQEEALGENHRELAVTLGMLGVALRELERLDEALAAHQRALAVAERSLGDHPDVARYRTNLGATLARLGRLGDALAQHRAGLEQRERLLDPEHHDLEESLNNLGMVLERRGRFDEAIPYYRRALAIEERALGSDHPDLAFTLDNLGVALTLGGRVDEATPLLRRALAIREKSLDPGHADFAASRDNLGVALLLAERPLEAASAHREALAIREATRGPSHFLTGVTYRRLGDALLASGAIDEALAAYRQALAIVEADAGAPDELARILLGLAKAQLARGDREDASRLGERAGALVDGTEYDPQLVAEATFVRARALGPASASARALALEARDQFVALGARGEPRRAAVDAWLRAGGRRE